MLKPMNGPVGQKLKERFQKDTGMILIGGAYFAAIRMRKL
jgi:hypothetical protein